MTFDEGFAKLEALNLTTDTNDILHQVCQSEHGFMVQSKYRGESFIKYKYDVARFVAGSNLEENKREAYKTFFNFMFK